MSQAHKQGIVVSIFMSGWFKQIHKLETLILCCLYTILIQCIFVFKQKSKAFAYLVFPNTTVSVVPEKSSQVGNDPMAHGIITSVTHGAMSGILIHFLYVFLVSPSIEMLKPSVPYASVFHSIGLIIS